MNISVHVYAILNTGFILIWYMDTLDTLDTQELTE